MEKAFVSIMPKAEAIMEWSNALNSVGIKASLFERGHEQEEKGNCQLKGCLRVKPPNWYLLRRQSDSLVFTALKKQMIC